MKRRDDLLLEEYLDGELPERAVARLEERLSSELELRRRLEALQAYRTSMQALPREATVPAGVWDGIREAIDADNRVGAADVIALGKDGTPVGRRRFAFTVPQLAAAALVLVSLGGAGMWTLAMSGANPDVVDPAVGRVGVTAVSTEARTLADRMLLEYEASAAELQAIVDEGSSVLSDQTLQIVRQSLATIDQAIDEARTALEADPGSEMLNRILWYNMQKKLDLLRNTAAAVQAAA